MDCLLAIDQGTTSTRCILFDAQGQALHSVHREIVQHFPADGWVEHDAEEIWSSALDLLRVTSSYAAQQGWRIAGIGITNQRETTVLWDRKSGKPIARAIVWQDRRTAETCRRLAAAGHHDTIREKTGLRLDSYFSATKIGWLLDHVEGARRRAEAGDLAFGTIDCFLLWRLTGGAAHATDATNAARTLLYDIHRQRWDEALLSLFGVPAAVLPEVKDNVAPFGVTAPGLLAAGPITIGGMAGDQQAAAIGQACFQPGMVKSTYGTGCFLLMNTGTRAVTSNNALLTTLAYRLDGAPSYALEGSIFVAGAALQWLRDGLKLIDEAGQSEALASTIATNGGVYLVPAFTGLGAPYWDAEARGALFGLTRATGIAEIVRAALEAVCYQTSDLLTAMKADGAGAITELRVDGGMAANGWLMQFLADILAIPVTRPKMSETTALGAAYLAGLQVGLFGGLEDLSARWQRDATFTPRLTADERDSLLTGWRKAVDRVRSC